MTTVAFAGNPNVGKSTLFNALTGLRQHTGNWSGKTVGVAVGTLRQNTQIQLVDLPGTYSMDGTSEDERLAADYIRQGQADCVVVVCDGSCLARNLILALEIIAHSQRVVLCVNLMDEARGRGIWIDKEKLSRLTGVPVVLTAAGHRQGLDALLEEIFRTLGKPPQLQKHWENPIEAANEIAKNCTERTNHNKENWRLTLDKILVSRRRGVPILVMLLFFIIWLTIWGANYPAALLEQLFDGGYGLLKSVTAFLPWWLGGILIDGIYRTTTQVIAVMLPPMAIFFPLFTLLEDIGYLPRMAFLLDRPMSRCGGCGKQALTMCMGLGCNAVGVTSCRIIDSPRERLAAILTNAMIPCNGRFPTLIILGSIFFGNVTGGVLVAGCVLLGVLAAMVMTRVVTKTVQNQESAAFLMELPPIRKPRIGKILVDALLHRTLHVASRALSVAAPAGAVLWLLANTPLLSKLAIFLEPLGLLLGMNGVILLAFVLSLPANELLFPIILMVLTGMGTLYDGVLSGEQLLSMGWTWQIALCTMVFTVFHWPCGTTLLTIYKETGSIIKTAAAFILPTAVGVMLCLLLRGILP